MTGEDVISRVKNAELEAAAIVAAAEREAEAMKSAAASDASDLVRRSSEESRRSYENGLLLERERVRQEKEEMVKAGRKRVYSEEETARSRMEAALERVLRKAEDYFDAEAR